MRGYSGQNPIMGWKSCKEPVACRYVYEYSNGRVDIFAIYFTPISPGVTRSFFKFVSQNPPKGFSLISKVPQWLFHNLSGSMSDQDAVMLHTQVAHLLSIAADCSGYANCCMLFVSTLAFMPGFAFMGVLVTPPTCPPPPLVLQPTLCCCLPCWVMFLWQLHRESLCFQAVHRQIETPCIAKCCSALHSGVLFHLC